MSAIQGERFKLTLPVLLGEEAQRQVMIETGVEPTPVQFFSIDSLAEVPKTARGVLLDISDVVDFLPLHGDSEAPLCWRYSALKWDHSEHGWKLQEPERYWDLRELYVPTPGRTLNVVDYVGEQLEDPSVLAALETAPVVSELRDAKEIALPDVVAAYQSAIELADRIRDAAVNKARRPDSKKGVFFTGLAMDEEMIFLLSHVGQGAGFDTACLLRESDPDAFGGARAAIEELQAKTGAQPGDFVSKVLALSIGLDARNDAELATVIERMAAEVISEAEKEQAKQEAEAAYEQERERWVGEHGSRRLQMAMARGYRSTGVYLDERLEGELPGFFLLSSLGRRPTLRHIINPTQEALDLEQEILARVEELDGEQEVGLFWVEPGSESELEAGEYVGVKGWLGRHTVYRPVSLEAY